jgi:hypothetical protein
MAQSILTRRDLIQGAGLGAFAAAMPFQQWYRAHAQTNPQVVRMNVNALDPRDDDIAGLVEAIRFMMRLPPTHPQSWIFQANVHLSPDDPKIIYARNADAAAFVAPLWNNCPHGSYYFLPWHRLYLYFLERRLRLFSGQGRLALNYWNYVTYDPANLEARRIPALFRQPSYFGRPNPLYVPDTRDLAPSPANGREPRYNAGAALDLADVTWTNAYNFTNFAVDHGTESFGGHPPPQSFLFGALEATPHNNIHAAIGGANGLMTILFYAARDPIFFFHHCNVDRLWESWLAAGQGRANPVLDPAWMGKSWTFLDEWSRPVVISVADAIAISGQLGYVYQDIETAPPDSDRAIVLSDGSPAPVMMAGPVSFDHQGAHMALTKASDVQSGTKWVLTLSNVTTDGDPGASFGIWLGSDGGGDTAQPGFVGAVALLDMDGGAMRAGANCAGGTRLFRFDVTLQMQGLVSAGLLDLGQIDLSVSQIRPLGPDGRPMDVVSHNPIRIGQWRLARE